MGFYRFPGRRGVSGRLKDEDERSANSGTRRTHVKALTRTLHAATSKPRSRVQESFRGKLLATRLQHESRGIGGKEGTSGDDSQLRFDVR